MKITWATSNPVNGGPIPGGNDHRKWELTEVRKMAIASDQCLLTIWHLKLVLFHGKSTQCTEQNRNLHCKAKWMTEWNWKRNTATNGSYTAPSAQNVKATLFQQCWKMFTFNLAAHTQWEQTRVHKIQEAFGKFLPSASHVRRICVMARSIRLLHCVNTRCWINSLQKEHWTKKK